jgi:hypothetical protein
MEFRVLGPLEVVTNGQPLALGGIKQRAVLAVLLLHANETVSVDRLIDALWGESPPSGALRTVRVHVSRLRKALEGGSERGGPSVLVTTKGGYELRVGQDDLAPANFTALYECSDKDNLSRYCDQGVDGKLDRALAVQRSDPTGSIALWQDAHDHPRGPIRRAAEP